MLIFDLYRCHKEELQLEIENHPIFLILMNQEIIREQLRKQVQNQREVLGKEMNLIIMKMTLKRENLKSQLLKNE